MNTKKLVEAELAKRIKGGDRYEIMRKSARKYTPRLGYRITSRLRVA